MKHTTSIFTGLADTPIFTQAWLPDGSPRAAVIIAHGLAEHSGRYAHVAAALVKRGYAVYALDCRGHGQSGGVAVHVDRFDDYVDDLKTHFDQVRTAHPGLPVFLYGHSMGSIIALLFAFRYQDDLAGLILTGTAFKLGGANSILVVLIKGISRIAPKALALPISAKGVSRDPAVVERYISDPLVYTGRQRFGLLAEFQRAIERSIAGLPSLRLPVLALHGSVDLLALPAGVEIVRQKSGSPDTIVKVYDGLYHEVHNEPEQAHVIGDMANWLDAHLPA